MNFTSWARRAEPWPSPNIGAQRNGLHKDTRHLEDEQ